MPTPEEITAMDLKRARDEAEQRNLARAGFRGFSAEPSLAPSANATPAPEIPTLTSELTQAPATVAPAPTLADAKLADANAKLGTAPPPPEAIKQSDDESAAS